MLAHDNLTNITSSVPIHQHQPMAARLEADVFSVKFDALAVQKPVQPITFSKHRLVVGALAFHHQVFSRGDDPRPSVVRKIFIEGIGAFHHQRFRNGGGGAAGTRRVKASASSGPAASRPTKAGSLHHGNVPPKSDGEFSVVSQSPSVSVA